MHLHPSISAELAHQHQADLRREAQHARLLSRDSEDQREHRSSRLGERLFGRRAARTPSPLHTT